MKKAKKLLVILCALALIVSSLSGCGTAKTEPQTGATSAPTTTQKAGTEGEEAKEREPIVITVGGIQATGTENHPEGNDFENNVWKDLYEKELGVIVETKWVVPAAQSMEKINLAIATGDIPDLMRVDMNQFNSMLEFDLVSDLTDVYEQYASAFTKQLMSSDDGVALSVASRNGRLYGIPYTGPFMGGTPVYWIRTDWLDKLNLNMPRTTEELYAVAKAFSETDFNGNGQMDTLGLALQMSQSINPLAGVMQSFNAYTNKWVDDGSGKAEFSALSGNAKKALEYLNSMYNDGIISREFVTINDEKLMEEIVSGRSGLFSWAWWAPYWSINNSIQNDPEAKWATFVVSEDGGLPQMVSNKTPGLFYAVSASFEHPEVVVEMANIFFDISRGSRSLADGEQYIHDLDGGNYWQFAQVVLWSPTELVEDYESLQDALNADDRTLTSVGRYSDFANIKDYLENNNLASVASYLAWGNTSAHSIFSQAVIENTWEDGMYFGPGTETMISTGAQLDKIILEGYAKLISGEAGYTFEKLKQDWLQAGGQTVTDEVNEYIEMNK